MKERDIRDCFSRNWAFRVVSQPLKNRFIIIAGIPFMIFLTGLLVSAILGVFPIFMLNPLAYGGPLAVSVSLIVFSWYAVAFPRILLNVYPALEDQTGFKDIITQWANRLMNRPWAILLIAIPVAMLNLVDLTEFWANPQQIVWPGAAWSSSIQSGFFALYYGFFSVIASAAILSTGAVTIIVSVIILFELLNTPIRLAHFRQLRSIGDLSIGLALWTFIPVVLTIGATFLKERPTAAVVLSGTLQSVMVACILLLAFVGPTLIARQAIIDAKFRRFVEFGNLQDQNYEAITQLLRASASAPAPHGTIQMYDQLKEYIHHVDVTTEAANKIDSIPNWPISFGGTVQLMITGIIPIIGFILSILRT